MKKKLLFVVLFVMVFTTVAPVSAQEVTVQKLYLTPKIFTLGFGHPKYFANHRIGYDGIECIRTNMDYGFFPYYLLFAENITQADHDALILNPDVYAFPDDLDQPITDPTLDTFFENINLPADWLTPSTTYRQALRYLAGMFQFNQAYAGIAAAATGQPHSIFDNGRTLENNWNSLSAQEKGWFNATIQLIQPGAPSVIGNPKLRSLAKQAGDLWGARSFRLGSLIF